MNSATTFPSKSLPRLVSGILLLAAIYAVAGWLARLPGQVASPVHASMVWPSAGIALGFLIVRGRGLWPGVWIGAFLIDAARLLDAQAPVAAAMSAALIATGATLQAVVGQMLARRALDRELTLESAGAVLRFYLLCGPLASLISATVGVGTLVYVGDRSTEAALLDWLSWWSGDTIGVLLATPIVFVLGASPRPPSRQRILTVALPLLCVMLVVTAGFFVVSRLEFANRQAEFERDAALLVGNAVQSALNDVEEASNAMADLFHANEKLSRREFGVFAAGINDRHRSIRALGWSPRVVREGLRAHERSTRAEGFPDYIVHERSREGHRVPVTGREDYFPVHFVAPAAEHGYALGFDHASEEKRRSVLERARQLRRPVVSERIALIGARDGYPGVLVVAPFFRAGADAGTDGLAGYIHTVIQPGHLLERALHHLSGQDIAYRLEDLDAAEGSRLLYQSAGLHAAPIYRHVSPIRFGDRHWQLSIEAGEGHRFSHRAWYVWAMLVSGVLGSGLLGFFILVMSGRSSRTEQLVAERTAQLEAARTAADKSSALLREAVSSIAQGFTIYDENDRLVICNETYRRFYEASRDLIVEGASFEEIVRRGAQRGQYPDAIGRIDEWVATRVRQHQTADGKLIEQRLGDGRWLLIVEYRTPSGYIVGNRIDISAIKEAEIALRMSEARARQIIENAPEPMLLVDAGGRILQLNGRTEAMFGYERGELMGSTIEILVPDDLRELHGRHREGFAQRPGTKMMGRGRELVARHRDGRNLSVEISLAPLESGEEGQVIVAIRDVTERRLAAAALADRGAQLDALFQLSPDGLVSFDRGGKVIFANPAFLRLTGMLSTEVLGCSFSAMEQRLRQAAEMPEQWPGLEVYFRPASAAADAGDGADRRQRHLLALRQPRGAVLELLGVNSAAGSVSRLLYARDVTHEVEVDRMKSEFLSHAAHELRTPMASIFGFSELLMTQNFDEATRKDLLATIHRQTAWLVDIINELLDLARIESRQGKDFRIEEVALAPLVGQVLAAMKIDPSRWPLNVACCDELPPARADAAKLRQALTNVLGNAVKYSPDGGAIDVRCLVQDRGGRDFLGIQVADHGIGMTADQAARVGERFYRADTSGKIPGTGLGMCIVKEILQFHGGSLEVRCIPGAGSTITLWLPAAPSDRAAASQFHHSTQGEVA